MFLGSAGCPLAQSLGCEKVFWEAGRETKPPIRVLQTLALPLGDRAIVPLSSAIAANSCLPTRTCTSCQTGAAPKEVALGEGCRQSPTAGRSGHSVAGLRS